jgi:aminopeptidase-like protein
MNIKHRNELREKELEFGKEIFELIKNCYPICRSITGNGVRDTKNFTTKNFT